MIPFNQPTYTGNEDRYVLEAIRSHKLSGDGEFGRKCQAWFENKLNCKKALLTSSCTHALEMAAMLIDVQPGDEIIMPSYTFVSTANAFVLRGAKIIFVDIRPDTMNINENLIESAVSEKTKAIVPVHYAGVGCEMDVIMEIADRHSLWVIEDAAQGANSFYKNKPLGSIGHLGAFSFHDTKNYTSGGEGGLLIVNEGKLVDRAEIIREKGTNRSQFFRGMVDKYNWVDIGSSYLLSELQAAYLWGQIEKMEEIKYNRLSSWNLYNDFLIKMNEKRGIGLPSIPDDSVHDAHMYYIKVADIYHRDLAINILKKYGISAAFHYVPLHSSIMGKKYGIFCGEDIYTTKESERLIRLPLWFNIGNDNIEKINYHLSRLLED